MRLAAGFERQPDNGACGKSSLLHAMLLLGIPSHHREVARLTRVPVWRHRTSGTSERALIGAIRRAGLRPIEGSYVREPGVHGALDRLLDRGVPAILSVQNGNHWVVLAGRAGATYWVIDSERIALILPLGWEQVARALGVRRREPELYFLGVEPRDRRQLARSVVPRFGRLAPQLLADPPLRERWGDLLVDLLQVFDCPARRAISSEVFFARHGATLRTLVRDALARAEPPRGAPTWYLRACRRIAAAHRLGMSPDREAHAIAHLACALTARMALDA